MNLDQFVAAADRREFFKRSAYVKAGQVRSLEVGISPQAIVPFGYSPGGYFINDEQKRERKPWAVHERNAGTVRQIHAHYIDGMGGQPDRRVAERP